MKKIFSIFSAAALLFSAVACQNEKPQEEAKFEISACQIAESAEFGETVDFAITAKAAQNVTVALIKDAKQLSSVTVRDAVDGVFSGKLELPYLKNIADGEYNVMVMAMGTGSDRAEENVKINLSHPEFVSVAFVAGTEKYELTASETVWSYTGALPASLAGYFEAKTAAGAVCNFGGQNVDNVEFGSTSAIDLYNYESAITEGTISFDVVSFQVTYPIEALYVAVPETTDAAYPGTVEVDFKKGQTVVFTGLGDLWVDIDFFDNNGDGTYTFRAEGGKYRLTNQADWGSLRTERISTVTGDLATFAWDDAGNITTNEAIWCLGNYNFGKPDMRTVRDGRVFSDWETYDAYCMAKIDDYKYQITLRVYNWASFKFFRTKLDWGDIYGSQYNLRKGSGSNLNGLINIYASDLLGNGNFQQGTGETDPNLIMYPEEGKVMRITFDVKNPNAIIVTAVEATM